MSVRVGARWRRCLGGSVILLTGLFLLLVAGACDDGGGLFIGEETPEVTRTPFFVRSPVAGTVTPLAGLTPTAGTPTPSPAIGATPIVNVTAVTPFEITVNEAVNIRQAPSASATILGIIAPGEKKNVVGEALGEEAAAGSGNRTWYALDGGGFVYSGLVEKVEGGGQ